MEKVNDWSAYSKNEKTMEFILCPYKAMGLKPFGIDFDTDLYGRVIATKLIFLNEQNQQVESYGSYQTIYENGEKSLYWCQTVPNVVGEPASSDFLVDSGFKQELKRLEALNGHKTEDILGFIKSDAFKNQFGVFQAYSYNSHNFELTLEHSGGEPDFIRKYFLHHLPFDRELYSLEMLLFIYPHSLEEKTFFIIKKKSNNKVYVIFYALFQTDGLEEVDGKPQYFEAISFEDFKHGVCHEKDFIDYISFSLKPYSSYVFTEEKIKAEQDFDFSIFESENEHINYLKSMCGNFKVVDNKTLEMFTGGKTLEQIIGTKPLLVSQLFTNDSNVEFNGVIFVLRDGKYLIHKYEVYAQKRVGNAYKACCSSCNKEFTKSDEIVYDDELNLASSVTEQSKKELTECSVCNKSYFEGQPIVNLSEEDLAIVIEKEEQLSRYSMMFNQLSQQFLESTERLLFFNGKKLLTNATIQYQLLERLNSIEQLLKQRL